MIDPEKKERNDGLGEKEGEKGREERREKERGGMEEGTIVRVEILQDKKRQEMMGFRAQEEESTSWKQ